MQWPIPGRDQLLGLSINQNKNLKIMVHPQLSHASADMISVVNNKKTSSCVARVLSSKKAVETIQTTLSHYFSPYGKIGNRRFTSTYRRIEADFSIGLQTLAGCRNSRKKVPRA